MSLQDEDDQISSECVDINNNNMTDDETYLTTEKQDSQPNETFFKELFGVYDVDQCGYILVEKFIQISKENMFDSFLGDEEKLKAFVSILDPKGCGRIEYLDFVKGMSSLMTDNKSESYAEGQGLISRSRASTFMEDETPVLQNRNHLTEEIFENYEQDTPNSSNKTSSNEFEYHENDTESLTEETDIFGLDSSIVQNHRKSLSVRKSISMGGMVRNSKRLSIQSQAESNLLRRSQSYQNHDDDSENTSMDYIGNEDNAKYEHIIEELEIKIKNLELQNEGLKSDINEQINKNRFQNTENTNLMRRIREFEDHNSEMERKFQIQIKEENNRHQDAMAKLQLTQQEENETLLNQIRNLEKLSEKQRTDINNNRKTIEEMAKNCEEKETSILQENAKLKELEVMYKNTLSKVDNLISDQEKLKQDYEEQIDVLKKELYEQKLLLESSEQEHMHERKNTMYDESYYINQIQQLETENRMFKTEIENLNNSLEELNANIRIYKANIHEEAMLKNEASIGHNFLPTLPASMSQESFLSEINSSKEDELLEKLIEERKNSQRLREYVEELTSKILEHDPAILENKINPTQGGIINRQTAVNNKTITTPRKQTLEKSSFKRLLKLVN